MVVLLLAIGKSKYNYTTREFADYLKKYILTPVDIRKTSAFEVK